MDETKLIQLNMLDGTGGRVREEEGNKLHSAVCSFGKEENEERRTEI